MKKYIIYSFLLSASLMSSCSGSFLDQNPPLYVEPGDIFNNPARIESAVLGLYAAIKNTETESFLGGKSYLVFDNRGEDIVNVDENLITLANTYNFKVRKTEAENTTTWSTAYAAINKVNIFLKELDAAKEVAGSKYEQYKAEAKFVRAIAYFYLNNLYSVPYAINPEAKSVPLRLEPQLDGNNNGMPRSTVSQVYQQILDDLDNIDALPTKTSLSEESVARATQAAAAMLKMRVYMAMQKWGDAVEEAKKVKGYKLTPKISDLFKAPYYTEETIFSLPMAITNTPNTQQGLGEYYSASKPILLVDVKNGIMGKENYNLPEDARSALKTSENRLLKFTDSKEKLDWVPIFRYAETLLNLAECYAELKDDVNARKYLKDVRSRSLPAEKDKLDIEKLSGEELKQAIYNERRLEFIGEGLRGVDVLRRGGTFERKTPITPEHAGYVWPIPQSEQLMNPDLDK